MVSSEASAEEFAQARHILPPLVRVLLRMFWGPAYAKRRHRLYHPVATQSRV